MYRIVKQQNRKTGFYDSFIEKKFFWFWITVQHFPASEEIDAITEFQRLIKTKKMQCKKIDHDNNEFAKSLKPDDKECMFYFRSDVKTKTLSYCSAGNSRQLPHSISHLMKEDEQAREIIFEAVRIFAMKEIEEHEETERKVKEN